MLVARVHLNDINRRSTNVPGPRGSKLLQIQVNDRDATGLNNRRDRKQTDRSNCPHGHFHLLARVRVWADKDLFVIVLLAVKKDIL